MNQELLDKIAAYKAKGFEVPDEDMIKTPEQIAGIREACKINTAVLDEVAKHIKAGMTTAEIDKIVYDFTVAQGATPAPLGFCGFPKSVCTSINDQVCHGIPSEHLCSSPRCPLSSRSLQRPSSSSSLQERLHVRTYRKTCLRGRK